MFVFGSGATVPAISRDIVECELIEQYHWLPQEIAKIPYKKLQRLLFIKKQRNANMQHKSSVNKSMRDIQSVSQGRTKKYTREV